MITVVYENCGDLHVKHFTTEADLQRWLADTLHKAIAIRGDNHDIEDYT